MPELLDDVEQLRKDDRRWREMLWYHHGCPSQTLYGDDGELQCNNLSCMIDFKRMSPAEIQDNWCRRGNKLIAAAGGMEEIIRQVREQNKRDKE